MYRVIGLLAMLVLLAAPSALAGDFNTPLGPSELSQIPDIYDGVSAPAPGQAYEAQSLQALIRQIAQNRQDWGTEAGIRVLYAVTQNNYIYNPYMARFPSFSRQLAERANFVQAGMFLRLP